MMSYDFDYYSGETMPKPAPAPKKPTLSQCANSTEARIYADRLADYEKEFVEHKNLLRAYAAERDRRLNEFKEKLRSDSKLSALQFKLLWEYAVDQTLYPRALKNVYEEFVKILDLISSLKNLTQGQIASGVIEGLKWIDENALIAHPENIRIVAQDSIKILTEGNTK